MYAQTQALLGLAVSVAALGSVSGVDSEFWGFFSRISDWVYKSGRLDTLSQYRSRQHIEGDYLWVKIKQEKSYPQFPPYSQDDIGGISRMPRGSSVVAYTTMKG